MRAATEEEFVTFVANKQLDSKVVPSGSATLRVYYSGEYDPRKREAYRSVGRQQDVFFIKAE